MQRKFYVLMWLVLSLSFSSVFAQNETLTIPKVISGGVLNEKAISLPEPVYPAAARAVRASGAVNVQVTIDENGDVINAAAVSGHPLLRAASVQAARQAKFIPTTLQGQTVKVFGTIVYIFILPEQWQFIGEALGDSEVEIEDTGNLKQAGEYLANVYPEISKSIKTIADNYEKDEESARFQTNAIGEIIAQLQINIANRSKSLWYFEFGLAVSRLKANYFDEVTLRANLPKIKELADTFPDSELSDDELENLKKLGEMSNQLFFSRKDKSKIKRLIDNL